jgi:hypothetical protein
MSSVFSNVFQFMPNIFTAWNLTNQQLLAIALLSGAASYVLVLLLASVRSLTIPISFACLFISGMFANWLFREYHFQTLSKLQETLIYTTVGHITMAIILLIAFRTERVR